MRRIFVVTHTEATHHIEQRVGGWHDSGLTEEGRRQASLTAQQLLLVAATREVKIVSSDLKRASETASRIGEIFGTEPMLTSALREISYGEAEGKPQAWLDERFVPAPDDNRLDHRYGLSGAESRRDVAARVYPFMAQIERASCETHILVTHGFATSLVIAAWMRIPVEGAAFLSFPVCSGSITHLCEDDRFHNRSLLKLGCTAHLGSQR